MGRRLNVSTPTVINTELVPLDESFYLDVDGQMEQWYYDNTEQYAPNRKVTPSLLVPVISAFDKDTSTSYDPAFNTTQWFANEWNESQGKYVETEITNQVDSGSADYVIQGNNLLVKKNVSYSHAVTIRCVATYIDPRDSGVTYTVEDSVNLTTNRTADVVFPEVDIISPSGRAYNPLVDDTNSQYDFKGVTTNNPVQPLNTDVRRYSVDVDGTEEILNSGEAVAPIMDIRYGENPTMEDQEFMYRQTAGGTLVGESIDKAYIERIKGNTVAWNQMINDSGMSSSATINGVTFTFLDHVLTVNGTASSTCFSDQAIGGANVSVVNGHKYYLKGYTQNAGTYVQVFSGSAGNKTIDADTIYTSTWSDRAAAVRYRVNSGTTLSNLKVTFQLFDLTLIYGVGNEPSTVAEFEADYERWFGKPLSYKEYDEGSLRPVLMQSVKTTGFNQFDDSTLVLGKYRQPTGEEQTQYADRRCSDVYFPCIPNTDYYLGFIDSTASFGVVICWYDANKNFISGTNRGATSSYIYRSPSNAAFFRISSAIPDGWISVNISNPSKNGTYEPYEEKVQGFDVTAIKGKLNGAGNSVTIFPDGLKKVGTIQDEIFVEGGLVKAIKRVGSRAYESGDESDTSVITDGSTTTFYVLTTPQTYVLDPITDFVWYGIKNGQEVLADTLPWYVSGQGTDNLVVDAMYGENINVVLRCKMMDGETLSPSKAYATLNWRTPDIEPFVQSDNGGAVRGDTEDMTFDTIVNVNGEVLSDALKRKHLAFNWKIRKNNISTETDKGWGQRITIDASDLRNVKGSGSTLASTLVGNEVYLKGAYEEVTDGGEVVTDNGEVVYDRPID